MLVFDEEQSVMFDVLSSLLGLGVHADRHPSTTQPSLLRDDQNLRDNRVTVQWRRTGCRASPYRHPGCHVNVVPPG